MEELQIKDDFMFGIIMRNPEICRMVLERILEIPIERVEYPEEQKDIRLLKDAGIPLKVAAGRIRSWFCRTKRPEYF